MVVETIAETRRNFPTMAAVTATVLVHMQQMKLKSSTGNIMIQRRGISYHGAME